jgi:outer membrane protein
MMHGFWAGMCVSEATDANKRGRKLGLLAAATALLSAWSVALHAESMSGALALAYQGNPDLNQERAGVRAADETIPQATSVFRPQITATGSYGYSFLEIRTTPNANISSAINPAAAAGSSILTTSEGTVGLTISQTLFNGFRNINGVRQAESKVFAAREQLRLREETILLSAATAYMNVLRDTAILDLRRNNIIVLEEQLRQTRDRFTVGEVTVTDVAQADASLASARSDYFAAQANLATSIANYRQFIGVQPNRLEPARTIEALLPRDLATAVNITLAEHPAVQTALHLVDAAALQVKIQEGQFYPTLSAVGQATDLYGDDGVPGLKAFNGTITAQVSAPIYTGGLVDAQVRQAKELLSQARIQTDLQRDMARAQTVSAWGVLDAARAAIRSNESAVKAAEVALAGIREEAKVGQRTTFDVLTAQQTLLNARVSLVTAQRDRVVASYSVMATIGRLTATNLSLNVTQYDSTIHYDAVKDKWIGVRTPDGR